MRFRTKEQVTPKVVLPLCIEFVCDRFDCFDCMTQLNCKHSNTKNTLIRYNPMPLKCMLFISDTYVQTFVHISKKELEWERNINVVRSALLCLFAGVEMEK